MGLEVAGMLHDAACSGCVMQRVQAKLLALNTRPVLHQFGLKLPARQHYGPCSMPAAAGLKSLESQLSALRIDFISPPSFLQPSESVDEQLAGHKAES